MGYTHAEFDAEKKRTRFIHVSTSIDGLLSLKKKELEEILKVAVDDDGKHPTLEEFMEYLLEEKAKGHKLIRNTECDNFDPVIGCLGHEVGE